MKRFLATIILLSAFSFCSIAQGQKIVFMPQWTPQAQFAGYYVAYEKGFYRDEGLDVEIRHVSTSTRKNTVSHLRAGEIDITTMQLLQAMVIRDGGFNIVNILQTSQNNSMCCISHTPIHDFSDLNGKKVGRWKTGFSELSIVACEDYNVSIEAVPFLNGTNLFISKAVDATFALTYNEYQAILYSMGKIPEENVLHFSDMGYNFPEDGVYCTEEYYFKNRDAVDKFVKASKMGWAYAAIHKDETLAIVKKYTTQANISTNDVLQKIMLDEVLNLQLDPITHKRTFEPVSKSLFNTMISKGIKAGLLGAQIDYTKFIK